MTGGSLPLAWQDAFRRDAEEKPGLADPRPERRQARLLAAFIVSGLLFMVAPGTLLGVWNLVSISSRREAEAISQSWIQAHGHAQFFGWVGTFIIGISLYALPKFRGSVVRSIPTGWVMWALWTVGVGLRWAAGVQRDVYPALFRIAAGLELTVAVLLLWQCSGSGGKHRKGQPWELAVFTGLAGLMIVLVWQFLLVLQPIAAPSLPAGENRALISFALWGFAFPVVLGYSLKFFPGLLNARPAHRTGVRIAMALVFAAAAGFVADSTALAAPAAFCAVAAGCWSLRVFEAPLRKPKTAGVDPRYPQFARLAYVWLVISAALGLAASRPGMLGASRHAFTVGFLTTLIFSIGPRILPAFLNSRELWSARVMRWSLVSITAGCVLRVTAEPLAYSGAAASAWKILPLSALFELSAVLLFALNLFMSLTTPIPAWIARKQINERLSVYWLVTSYPATRKLLVDNGLATLGNARAVPKSLTLGEAARADGVPADILVEKLGAFFDARLALSLRKQESEQCPS